MDKQAKVIMASFIYFAIVLEKNETADKIPESLKTLFRKIAWISEKYKSQTKLVTDDLNEILKDTDVDVDFMLLSVSLISEYYTQMRGKKRLFTPMKWNEILDMQEECMQLSDKNTLDTFDVAETIVKGLLK